MDTGDKLAFGGFGFMVALAITALAAWVTHVIWIISTLASDVGATVGQMVLGAIGAFMPLSAPSTAS